MYRDLRLTTATDRSEEYAGLRVAKVARAATAIPAIIVSRNATGRYHFVLRAQNKWEMYSRIWCFQYGQSCPPIGPQLSSEWRIPLCARIPEK